MTTLTRGCAGVLAPSARGAWRYVTRPAALRASCAHRLLFSGGNATPPPPGNANTGSDGAAKSTPSNETNSAAGTAAPRTKMSLTIRSPQQRRRLPPAAEARQGDRSGSKGGAAAGAMPPQRVDLPMPLLGMHRALPRYTEPVKRIILIRNGRSEANVNISAYVSTPDWRIPLVEQGKLECVQAGRELAEMTKDEPVYFYYSPYIRSRQSLRYVLQGYDEECERRQRWAGGAAQGGDGRRSPATLTVPLGDAGSVTGETAAPRGGVQPDAMAQEGSSGLLYPDHPLAERTNGLRDTSLVLHGGSGDRIIGIREDVRLRDGDIGRYHSTRELLYHLEERERYGKFFYRFPYGESGADVCDRVTSFLEAFQRERVEFPMDTNVVLITHGLTMRMFIKRWFHLTVETFHQMCSPPSGALCSLTRLHHRSRFRLDENCVDSMRLPLSLNEDNGYKYRNKQLLGSMSSGAPFM